MGDPKSHLMIIITMGFSIFIIAIITTVEQDRHFIFQKMHNFIIINDQLITTFFINLIFMIWEIVDIQTL